MSGRVRSPGVAPEGRQGSRSSLPSSLPAVLACAFVLVLLTSGLAPQALSQAQPAARRHSSSPIAITPDGETLLVANPDSNTLSLVDTAGQHVTAEVPVGVEPRSVAVSPDGSWACVACRGSDSVCIVDLRTRSVAQTITVGVGPVAVAVAPHGNMVAVAEAGDDQVRILETASWTTRSVWAVADRPYGLAFTPEGRRLLVTHLLSGEVTVLNLQPFGVYLPLILRGGSPAQVMLDSRGGSPLTGHSSRVSITTWPNVAPAPSVVVNSNGTRAYLPQTMANGLGLNTAFDTSVFPKVSVLDLERNRHQTAEHISLPETDQPVGLPWDAVLARGDTELWVVHAASNDLSVIDIAERTRPRRTAHIPLGDNPRGIVLHPDGSRAYVNNTLSGSVTVIDTRVYTVTAVIPVTEIPLPPVLLLGKRLFHSSARPDLAQARWISCNTCHIEAEHDGRTWLLQYMGEVPAGASAVITRNTTSLLGMIETYPLRWSAEWDESADSEFSIRFEQFGTGLIQGDMNPTLGPPNGGRSWELDCLASFIDSLEVPRRTQRLTEAERNGRRLFEAWHTGCLCCHPAPLYTDLKAHDVGTASAYGEWFGPLIDTPTLRFLYDSAPYLHDGSAASLHDVLTTANPNDPHGMTSTLTEEEINDLIAFLLALPYSEEEELFTYQSSPCLGPPERAVDRIELRAEGCDIVMAHHDAVYNCCAHVGVYLEDQAPLLRLVEQEDYPDSEPCRCLCTHEVTARLANLPPGSYDVEVWNGVTRTLLTQQTLAIGTSCGSSAGLRPSIRDNHAH